MCRFLVTILIGSAFALQANTASALKRELPGDIVMIMVPVAGLMIAHHKDDAEGSKQLLRSVAAGVVAHAIAAYAFNQTSWGKRPNGGQYAFPSGHVTLVVSGAAFLQDRYGWKYGLPAYALSGYVAWLRVDTGHHRWRDVIGGAALGYGVSKLFVTPQNATHIAPVIGPEFIGLRWGRSY
jgi:membrane-associated phospholipid phosphatase